MTKAFTLVELLVVIAIISVVASLLLPALAGARESAKQSACLSNLHSLQMALRMYADDHEGYAPPYTTDEEYLSVGGTPPSTSDSPRNLVRSLAGYARSDAVWFCPSDRFARTATYFLSVRHQYSSYLVVTWATTLHGIRLLNLDSADPEKFLIGDAVSPLCLSDPNLVGQPPYPVESNHGSTITQFATVGGWIVRKPPGFLYPSVHGR